MTLPPLLNVMENTTPSGLVAEVLFLMTVGAGTAVLSVLEEVLLPMS